VGKQSNRASRICRPGRARNLSAASRFYILQLLASSAQTFLAGQSPTQAVFSFQEKRSIINFHSYDIYLPGDLIFDPVPYFHHRAASLPNLLGNANRLALKSIYEILVYPYCPFFGIIEIQFNDSSAMRTLDKLLGFQADPVEFELLLA
jgi:hypothetical protein